MALKSSAGRRRPYAFLLPAVILAFLCCLVNVVELLGFFGILEPTSMVSLTLLPVLSQLAGNWAQTLLFVSIIFVFFNQQIKLRILSAERSGKVHVGAYVGLACFACLLFALGTASAAFFNAALNTIQSLENFRGLYLAYNSFVILSVVPVVAYALWLFLSLKHTQISDRVIILLFIVFPRLISFP
jgi:hypothetical protein